MCSAAARMTIAFGALAALAARPAAAAEPARAPDKETCVASFDRGQRAQSDRALRKAQSELIVCSQESCPAVLRADCAGVLAEVRSALPTIVFAADDGNGHELTDVKVYAGTELLVPTLDGRAIAVDPGTIELRFEREGKPPVVASRNIREGEKSRVIRVSLTGDQAAAPSGASGASSASSTSSTNAKKSRASRSALGWVLPGSLTAVGLAGLGVALFTRLDYDGSVEDLRRTCAPECTQEQRSDLSSTVVTSNVALGVGMGALAIAVVAFIATAPSTTSTTAPAAAGARSQRSTLGTWTW